MGINLAEGSGFVPNIAIFWANITQFVAQFEYIPENLAKLDYTID